MNPRTEPSAPPAASEFSPEFIQILVALTGATLLLVFAVEHIFSRQAIFHNVSFTPFPWIIAAGLTISDGLTMFSGGSPVPLPVGERTILLVSMLATYVVGPTLFFFGWRNRKLEKQAGKPPSILGLWTMMFVLGGIFTFSAAIPAVPIALIQRSVSQSLRNAEAIQRNKDMIIDDINSIAWNARQYQILPKSFGGGEGSYISYHLPPELASTENGTYEIVASQSECTVRANSRLYPGSTVSVKVDKDGKLWNWNYAGQFQ
jgi:hypothetical protein